MEDSRLNSVGSRIVGLGHTLVLLIYISRCFRHDVQHCLYAKPSVLSSVRWLSRGGSSVYLLKMFEGTTVFDFTCKLLLDLLKIFEGTFFLITMSVGYFIRKIVTVPMLDNLQSRNDNFILLSWLIHTFALKDIESGPLKHWQTKAAPDVAIRYWKLPVSMKCFKALKFGKKSLIYCSLL